MAPSKRFFVTATDTHVGKTVAVFVLGVLFKAQGHDVGVCKPVQCAGDDAQFLKKRLHLADPMELINPCCAPEPLSPHLAFRRAKKKISIARIQSACRILSQRHDVLLIEGAGGLMVPLRYDYYNADLIRDLDAPLIIISRRGLGTINHTLLTIAQAKAQKLRIHGVLFSDATPGRQGVAEQTNPQEIQKLSGVKVLGTIPFLRIMTPEDVLRQCAHLQLS